MNNLTYWQKRRIEFLMNNPEMGREPLCTQNTRPIYSNCHGVVLWVLGADRRFVDLFGDSTEENGLRVLSRAGDRPQYALFPKNYNKPGALDKYFMDIFFHNFCEEIREKDIKSGEIMRADGFEMEEDVPVPASPLHSAIVWKMSPLLLFEQNSGGQIFRTTRLKEFRNITKVRWYNYKR